MTHTRAMKSEMVRRARIGNPYSLVFMDVRMPRDGRYGTIEDIWKIDPDIGVVYAPHIRLFVEQIVTAWQNDNLLFIRPLVCVPETDRACNDHEWSLKMQVKRTSKTSKTRWH